MKSRRSLARLLTLCLSLAVIAALVPAPAAGQLTRGFISGTVTDASDARLPGVQVVITNAATGIRREMLTNESGVFRFVAVEPGDYDIEFSLAGFDSRKRPDVHVNTNQEVVINHVMTVGGVATEVTVLETPGLEIEKASATISRTLPERVVNELPITAGLRDVTRLALLAPTVARGPGSNQFSANGQRARNNNFLIDGTDNNDSGVTLNAFRVIPEIVAEQQTQTATYSAEFGRSAGAQFSVITRSGSNDFHGEVYDFYRGNWLEPVALTNKRAGVNETPRFVHHQLGANAGGPIIRGKTFFFGAFDTNRRREGADARNATSANILTPAGYAALASVPLRAGQTQASRNAALDALKFLPEIHGKVARYENVRTNLANGIPVEVGTIRIPLAAPYTYYYAFGRVDHQLTSRDSLTYRYILDKQNDANTGGTLSFGDKWSADFAGTSQNHAVSHTRTFTPNVINEFRFAFIRSNLDFPERDPKSSTVTLSGLFTIGGASNYPQARVNDTYQFQNVSTYIRGRQSIKFGADIRWAKLFNRSGFDSKGTWTFNNLQDFLNNQASELRQAVNESTFDARQTSTFLFFQDDIKVTRNLTLNLGLRYERSTIPFGFFGAANDQIAAALVPRNTVADTNNWAPRVGFAYSPSGTSGLARALFGQNQTAIRGGFGMGYDILFFNILTVNASNYPRVVTDIQNNISDVFPALLPKQATVPAFNPLAQFVNAPTNMQNPTVHYWSLSVQRELAASQKLELGYSGNRSYHGIRQNQANPAVLTPQQAAAVIAAGNPNTAIPSLQARRVNPNIGSRILIEDGAKGVYHAGFVRFDKNLSNGLLVGANYTFSGNFSDNDESLGVGTITTSSPQVPQDYFNIRNEWSRSVFDRPHRIATHYVYEIPWFASLNRGAMKHIFNGWQFGGTTEWQSGQPFTMRTGVDSSGNGSNVGRPNLNAAGTITRDPVTGDYRTFTTSITGSGIVVAPLGPNGLPLANSMPGGGNLGRNTFRGPEFFAWNLNLLKNVTIHENLKVQIRADFINLLNHRNYPNPEPRMNNSAFGQSVAALITDNRSILLSAKIRF